MRAWLHRAAPVLFALGMLAMIVGLLLAAIYLGAGVE